ncbi:MAG: lipopolysaccharide biosynthesis protein, partial [Candidatus Velamenicoccus archaeovorus]
MTSPNDPTVLPPSPPPPSELPKAEGAALGALLGLGEGARDHLTILSGTAQNVVGLAVFVLASFGMNIVIARAFGDEGRRVLGLVTLATQLAFVAAGATRFGMDMAAVRRVAIEVGKGGSGRSRAVVRLAVTISAIVSLAVAVVAFLLAAPIAGVLNAPTAALRAAAVALPFVAVAQVILGGSRGLKIMRDTLVAYWVGQPISWIVFSLIAWTFSKTVTATVVTYGLSWLFATVVAWFLWHRDTRRFDHRPAEPGEVRA